MTDTGRNEKFEALLTAALERQPEVVVPVEFTVRVMQALPKRKPVRVTHYGRMMAYVCALVLMVTLVWLPVTHPGVTMSVRSVTGLIEIGMTGLLMLLFWVTEASRVMR
jgi:hypothetical protein